MKRAKGKRMSILICLLGAVFLFSTGMALHTLVAQGKEKAAFDDLSAIVAEAAKRDVVSTPEASLRSPVASSPTQTNSAQPNTAVETPPDKEADPVLLPQYATLYEMNADFFGWLSIEGTDIDYPVMFSPDRPEYYLNRAFDGSYSGSGVPFIDGKCPADGNYYLIYGHHMQNKTMFGQLPKYADKSYYEEHPTIRFDTLYEQREYLVIAAFYSHIYGKNESGVFRYYEYTDLTDEAVFEEEIIFCIPSISDDRRREILDFAVKTGVSVKIAPDISSLDSAADLTYKEMRNVDILDLLSRPEIKLNPDVCKYVTDKTVLVTGGGGSIGSELCRQIARYNPETIVIFDIYENNAYELKSSLDLKYFGKPKVEIRIGSVREYARLKEVFEEFHPSSVFHAAAHKHVPLMEDSPYEAIKNNVLGTYNTALCANEYGVDNFVLLSTDKAVNPTNVMGATKRCCELIIQHFSKISTHTKFAAVRFGNVLGSNGSVIPLFKEQLKKGGPLTVTHPDITRYFMTIPEAAQLVVQAGGLAKGGEIFVLDMGEPVKIVTLAEKLIRLSGFEPYVDIDIQFTGLRPGEKLYEELILPSEKEGMHKTDNHKIFITSPTDFDDDVLLEHIKSIPEMKPEEARQFLKELVPNFNEKK